MAHSDKNKRAGLASGGAILSVNLSADAYGKNWEQCGRLVDYLARYVSSRNDDVERGAMMYSAALNEVLEAIARNHAPREAVRIELQRTSRTVELSAQIPVDETHRRFYGEAGALMLRPDLKDWYEERIRSGAIDVDGALLGLVEVATVFRSSFRISDGPYSINLTVTLPLSEMEDS